MRHEAESYQELSELVRTRPTVQAPAQTVASHKATPRYIVDAGIRDFAELYRLLTSASTDERRILTHGTPAQPFLEGGNERMFGSIRSAQHKL